MTETKGMKSPSKSFDVFEFREEDELNEMAVKKTASDFGSPQVLNAGNNDEKADPSCSVITAGNYDEKADPSCSAITAGNYDEKADPSCSAIAAGNYNEKAPELTHVLRNDFNIHERATEMKPNIESGIVVSNSDGGSSPGASLPLEDHSNDAFPFSSCHVKSVCLASDAVDTIAERSQSDISNNDASSDGASSDNCFGGGDLDDERVGVVVYADYVDYQGTLYMDSVVSFSKNYVAAKSKTIYGNENFHIQLEIEDIVKIESQWSAELDAGMVHIFFIPQVEFKTIRTAPGFQVLKFPVVESNWDQKQEAIESLDARYSELCHTLHDGGVEKCSSLPEREDWMLERGYFPNFERPFDEVIYPKGDPDAVSISKRDLDLLLPDTFVNDTIIDFYIKYLKTKQSVDDRTKFHFFNSFFFRKLADMDKDPSSAFDGKAAFQRVRKWTRKVNLLEKDFILIPVNYNLHWTLLVICYFGEIASYKDQDEESGRVPCILHMDSLRGTHSDLKDLIQSYLWEEWKERQKGTSEDLYSKFRNLKFIPLELPQQQNSYDCGLFLLHYVELFMEEVQANFNIHKITSSSKFLGPDWFPPGEPSIKRTHIERLISRLLDSKSEESPPSGGSGMHCSPEELNANNSFENDIPFTVKSCPSLSGCRESSLCLNEPGIEMTLLPTSSSRSTQCTATSNSGLVLKELFKQGSAPESFTAWAGLESRASLYELKNPAPIIEEEVKASECFVNTELTDHGFPYSSEDYRPEAVYRPTPDNDDSIPVTSGALLNEEGFVDINDPTRDHFFMKNLSELSQEANRLHNHATSEVVSPTLSSGNKLNFVECDSSNDRVNPPGLPSDYPPDSPEKGELDLESDERDPKRIKISTNESGEGLDGNLAQDLKL